MKSRAVACLLATIVALSACADASTDESVPGVTTPDTASANTTAPGAQDESVDKLENEIAALGEAIASSESGQELSSAWNTLKVELAAAVATLRSQGEVARDNIESALDTFEQKLDELNIEENVRAVWDELRSRLEQLAS